MADLGAAIFMFLLDSIDLILLLKISLSQCRFVTTKAFSIRSGVLYDLFLVSVRIYLRVMTGLFQNGCHENFTWVIQFQ